LTGLPGAERIRMRITWIEPDGRHVSYVTGERANAVLEMVMTTPTMALVSADGDA
jgi:hypothetical protein